MKEQPRLGITVTRHYGAAHERNRFKRVVREAFRLCRHKLPLGIDLHVKPGPKAFSAKTPQLIEEILFLLKEQSPRGLGRELPVPLV